MSRDDEDDRPAGLEAALAWLPSLERAAGATHLVTGDEADVPMLGPPNAAFKMAAVVLQCSVVRREYRDTHESPGAARPTELATAPPDPDADLTLVPHAAVVGRSGKSVVVRTWTDRAVAVHEVYVPSQFQHMPQLAGFDDALTAVVRPRDAQNPVLGFDLGSRLHGSAYRGAAGVRDPEFHGHVFGDALAQARAELVRLAETGTIVRAEYRTFAWPFLVLRYDHSSEYPPRVPVDAILTVDRARRPRVYVRLGDAK